MVRADLQRLRTGVEHDGGYLMIDDLGQNLHSTRR